MRRPIRAGARAGILMIALTVLSIIVSFTVKNYLASTVLSLLFTVAVSIASVLFYYAFIIIARKHDAGLLKTMSWMFMVVSIVFGVLYILFTAYMLIAFGGVNPTYSPEFTTAYGNSSAGADLAAESGNAMLAIGVLFGFLWLLILMVILFITAFVLNGIGLLKLHKKFSIAKPVGILDIIAGGLCVTIILIPVAGIIMLISYGMKVNLLFKASKAYEK